MSAPDNIIIWAEKGVDKQGDKRRGRAPSTDDGCAAPIQSSLGCCAARGRDLDWARGRDRAAEAAAAGMTSPMAGQLSTA